MIKSNCKWCKKEIIRPGFKKGIFCSRDCKGEFQRTQKPVDKDWLYQKYVTEGLSTYQIGKLVDRNPKRVWEWLSDYGIDIRKREWDTVLSEHIPYHDKVWLSHQYLTQKKSSKQISEEQEVTENNILYFLKRFGIKTREMTEIRKDKYWGLPGEENPMFGKRGKETPNWKGGVTPERQSVYVSQEWKGCVKQVWKRDEGICQRCGVNKGNTNKEFHIHHIKPFSSSRKDRTNVDNLVLLCKKCHNFVHSKKNLTNEYLKDIN